MELERARGISVSSTVLRFAHGPWVFNLLDTPGHADFSEDTYRTLWAADAAIVVIDRAKGIEPQTRKLFRVCRARGIPIITFVNKCDRPGLGPLALLDEIEREFDISPVPMTWPVGDGIAYSGIVDRVEHVVEDSSGRPTEPASARNTSRPSETIRRPDVLRPNGAKPWTSSPCWLTRPRPSIRWRPWPGARPPSISAAP